ncbi:PIR Superfamily Protein [Plasmodium ovale wallikeri]|uniref:PIR Superfamily Protein n=1 Tax=Plasmodium ovale wallikeri TaxID=864142 RepID=A0A1A8YLY1_PLAOA|nr:PIR Superfamily Protein [Plasmodium ovale wallikeri]
MSCTYESKGKYEFIEHIHEYRNYEVLIEQNEISTNSGLDCNFSEYYYVQNKDMLCGMCKKFIHLVDLLFNKGALINYNEDHIKDYLNYWFNNKLNEIDPENICKKDFFQNLTSKISNDSNLRKLRSSIYDIEKNEFKRLTTIYTLYMFYNEIKKIIHAEDSNKENIIDIANNCVQEYKKIEDICPTHDAKFCMALKSFEKKYEEINLCNLQLVKWKKQKLPLLTGKGEIIVDECTISEKAANEELEQPQGLHIGGDEDTPDIDKQNITLGAFTSFGRWLRSRISKNKNIIENLGENVNQFSHISELDHMDSINTYNIAYNSV